MFRRELFHVKQFTADADMRMFHVKQFGQWSVVGRKIVSRETIVMGVPESGVDGSHFGGMGGGGYVLGLTTRNDALRYRVAANGLGGESGERLREDFDAGGELFGAAVLVGAVGDAGAAGDEDHAHRGDASHEEGVVVGAAGHRLVSVAEFLAGGFDGRHHQRVSGGRRVGVVDGFYPSHAAAIGDGGELGFDCGEDAVAVGAVDVAEVERECDVARELS